MILMFFYNDAMKIAGWTAKVQLCKMRPRPCAGPVMGLGTNQLLRYQKGEIEGQGTVGTMPNL